MAKKLAHFVRTHEKALANALQLRRQASKDGLTSISSEDGTPIKVSECQTSNSSSSTSSALAAALSLGSLSFTSHNIKAAKLALTPHHLYYLLDRFEDMGISIGLMNVRLENIHTEASPANYVSFLGQSHGSRGRSDRDSIHSVSSVRSVMSGMSSLWSGLALGSSSSASKTEKAKAQLLTDLKYLYSAFTKIPCLRLSTDRKARLIGGYEEFPFDTAVPLLAFKNLSALEICDVDFRQFYGWDRLAEQLRSLTVKRSQLDDPADLFVNIVLDDMDKRRRRSSRAHSSPVMPWPASPTMRFSESGRYYSTPGSPLIEGKHVDSTNLQGSSLHIQNEQSTQVQRKRSRTKSASPSRPSSSRQENNSRIIRGHPAKVKRSGSNSSTSSTQSSGPNRTGSFSNLLMAEILPASKWRFLKHLCLADNSLISMTGSGLVPLANSLHSLDLSTNLFTEMPDCLATLTALRALNVSNCMIASLHSLTKNPLPAITALNLRGNRLISIAGAERLLSLERLDLRDNKIQDPTEIARLTGIPGLRELWILRNPFVRTHSDYRVTVFNLFRSTPGYLEDIVIDSTGPGYGERRHLRDRIAEREGVPVVKQMLPEPITSSIPLQSDVVADMAREDEAQEIRRPSPPQWSQSEFAVGSGRRKKGSRRRIVDLARDQSPPVLHQEILPDASYGYSSMDLMNGPKGSMPSKVQSEQLPPLQMSAVIPSLQPMSVIDEYSLQKSDPRRNPLTSEVRDPNITGDAYKQKVEALKNEVGSDWLSILSGEKWNNHQKLEPRHPRPHLEHVDTLRPEAPGYRATSQIIANGQRTVG